MIAGRTQSGFTLFEVAISLVLIAFGVISVMMLYPMGIKTQQLARFQLMASVKAEEMIEAFSGGPKGGAMFNDLEGLGPWDSRQAYKPFAYDLESRLSSFIPMPTSIARRLDSENNEIQDHLSAGGDLYFSPAAATTSIAGNKAGKFTKANETQKLVFAVTGHAQHNHILYFPWKAWPYYTAYPSPPYYGAVRTNMFQANGWNGTTPNMFLPPTRRAVQYKKLASAAPAGAPNVYCWEAVTPNGTPIPGADPDVEAVFDAYWLYAYGPNRNAGPSDPRVTEETAIAYLQTALWYAQKKGLGPEFYAPATIPNPAGDFQANTLNANGEDHRHEAWKQVQAMRYISHAATCLTRFKTLAQLGGQPSVAANGLSIPAHTTLSSPAITLTHDLITYYHERCMNLSMRYTASFPYDWAAPRNTARFQMMDFPLIEYDMFEQPLKGKIFDISPAASRVDAVQWKPVPARKIYNVGVGFHFAANFLPYATTYSGGTPTKTMPDGSVWPITSNSPYEQSGDYKDFWGDPSHSTLTKPFQPHQRCRQIVFWAVDWQSYEDVETAPSATVDAAHYPLISSLHGVRFAERMTLPSAGEMRLRGGRNPEISLCFFRDISGRTTGADVSGDVESSLNAGAGAADIGLGASSKRVFSGIFGADRNNNKILDRGPLPASVRMRATTVARFNYYDPRLTLSIR